MRGRASESEPPRASSPGGWAAAPLAPVALAFALGLTVGQWAEPAPIVLWLAAGLAAVATGALLLRERPGAAAPALLLTVGIVGAVRGGPPTLPADHVAREAPAAPVRLEGRLAAEPIRWAPDRTRLLVDAEWLDDGASRRTTRGRVQLTLYGEAPPLAEGQRIAGEFRLHRPHGFRNPAAFDYPASLARQGILLVGGGRADRLEVLTPERPPWPVRVKRWAVGTMARHLPPASAALLAGLLLGERSQFPPEAHEAFRRAGVYHILAVSGFNVGLIASAIFAGLALLRLPRRLAALAAILLLVGFAMVVGGEPSVVRATLMATVLLLGLLVAREASLFNSVALAGLLLLVWRPGDLWDPGFQLSFAATLGILHLAPAWTRALRERGCPPWLAAAVAVSLGAQLGVVPIMLTHFNQLSLAGIVANLVVVPLAALATTLGLASLLLSLLSDGLGHLLFQSAWLLLLALRAAVGAFAAVPAAMVHLPAPPPATVVAFYGALALSPRWGAGRTARGAVTALAAVVLAASLWPWVRPGDGRLRLTFLDVGQGEATLVELPDGRRLLVDAGPGGERRFDVGERVIAPFLWSRFIHTLDAVAVTHADPDHAGGLGAILRRFRVRELWTGGAAAETLGGLGPAQGTVRRRLVAGDRFWLGSLPVTVLGPPATPPAASARGPASDENNASLVLRLDWGLASFLLAGDIEEEAEAALVESRQPLAHLVLKVAHHGSRFSTTEALLQAGRPALAVVSAGRRNPFRHPHAEVLARLEKAGVRLYRTDRDGAVIVETDGARLWVTRWAARDRGVLRLDAAP